MCSPRLAYKDGLRVREVAVRAPSRIQFPNRELPARDAALDPANKKVAMEKRRMNRSVSILRGAANVSRPEMANDQLEKML